MNLTQRTRTAAPTPIPLQWDRCLGDKTLSDHAGVAELADAPDSKSGGRKALRVRVPPPASLVRNNLQPLQKPPVLTPGAFSNVFPTVFSVARPGRGLCGLVYQ